MVHLILSLILFSFVSLAYGMNCEEIKKKYTCYETDSSSGFTESVPKTYPIHLTFDDGPIPGRTEKVLAALKKHKVPATFFVVGSLLESKSSSAAVRTLRKIQEDGHLIGSHSYEHVLHTMQSKDRLSELIKKARYAGQEKIVDGKKVGEYLTKPLLFRFPYGDGWHELTKNPKNKKSVMSEIKKYGFSHIGWDFHSYDWDRDKQQNPGILDIMLREICDKKGGISLLHDNQLNTVNHIDEWISAMKCLGHKFVGLETFFQDDNAVNVCEGASFGNPLGSDSLENLETVIEVTNEVRK